MRAATQLGNFRRLGLAVCAVLASLGATSAQSADSGASPKAPFAAEPDPHPALWKVEGSNSTIYIFGSIHLLPGYVAWKSPAVDAAMAKAKTFVFESPDDRYANYQTRTFIQDNGFLAPGQRLRAKLSSDAQMQFDRRITEFGFSPNKFDALNPWLASVILKVTFLENIGYSSEAGADTTIVDYARQRGRDLRYLEAPQVGLRALASLGDLTGVHSVETTLADMDDMPAILQDLIGRWQTGDVAGMSRMLDRSMGEYPEVGKLLLLDRNRAWTDEIGQMATQHTTFFITVGIAHLAGTGSLIADLCGKGLHVSRVDTDTPSDACAAA
jgi:hypothetical protein